MPISNLAPVWTFWSSFRQAGDGRLEMNADVNGFLTTEYVQRPNFEAHSIKQWTEEADQSLFSHFQSVYFAEERKNLLLFCFLTAIGLRLTWQCFLAWVNHVKSNEFASWWSM